LGIGAIQAKQTTFSRSQPRAERARTAICHTWGMACIVTARNIYKLSSRNYDNTSLLAVRLYHTWHSEHDRCVGMSPISVPNSLFASALILQRDVAVSSHV
jgi:hypothetical protein